MFSKLKKELQNVKKMPIVQKRLTNFKAYGWEYFNLTSIPKGCINETIIDTNSNIEICLQKK